MRKHAIAYKYDYLEVLSYHVWKPGRRIKIDMERLKGGWLGYVEVYEALAQLEDQGFVERRICNQFFDDPYNPNKKINLKAHSFRLTSQGIGKKKDLQDSEGLPSLGVTQPSN